MKERSEKIIFWCLFLPIAVAIVYVLSVRCARPTKFQPIGPKLFPYLNELGQFRKIHGENQNMSPDGTAEVSVKSAPFTSVLEGCNEVWINFKDGHRQRVMKLYESDPGSGISFHWNWSKDSKAVFIGGQTMGFNCSRENWKEFDVVYLVRDDKLWDVVLK